MIYSSKSILVLDACVLYPARIRDILMSLAYDGLFTLKWSEIIQNEWLRNLLKNCADLKMEQLNQTIKAMDIAFPEAKVENFSSSIFGVKLQSFICGFWRDRVAYDSLEELINFRVKAKERLKK